MDADGSSNEEAYDAESAYQFFDRSGSHELRFKNRDLPSDVRGGYGISWK